jgi:hypothetical protein
MVANQPDRRDTLSSPTVREGCALGFKKTTSGVFDFENCLSGITWRDWLAGVLILLGVFITQRAVLR